MVLGLKKKLKKDKAASARDKNLEREFQKGVTTLRDLLSPAGVKLEPSYMVIGDQYARTIFALAYPRYLNTAWFAPIVNYDIVFDASMFVHPAESSVVLKQLEKQVTRVQSQISSRVERGMIRDPKLEIALGDLEELRNSLQTGQERFFKYGLYITVYGNTLEELDKNVGEIKGLLETYLVYTKTALFTQEAGFASTMPLSEDALLVHSNMNTAPLSTTFPFVSSDLSSNRGILYGINRHNNSLVLFDRFGLENANTVVFGKSGAGKSYAIKLEILRSMAFGADVIIIDLENEYQYLAEAVGGSFINISLSSPYHINPFDLPPRAKDENPEDLFRSHLVQLAGLFKLMLSGVTAEEDAILDKALREVYASRDITPTNENFESITPPRMQDLQEVLEGMEGADSLATRLEKYTRGTYSGFFNNYTNIDLSRQLVVFNLRDLEDEFRPVAMYMVLNYIWRLVRSKLKKRILFVDEAWWLMKYDVGASFLFSIAKRARKYFLGLTTITQDVSDFAKSQYGKPIVSNSSLQMLLKQSPAEVDDVRDLFNLTQEEKYLLLEAEVGEGLFFAGLKHVAVKVVASYSEDQLITSDPQQLLEIEKAKEELKSQAEATAASGADDHSEAIPTEPDYMKSTEQQGVDQGQSTKPTTGLGEEPSANDQERSSDGQNHSTNTKDK